MFPAGERVNSNGLRNYTFFSDLQMAAAAFHVNVVDAAAAFEQQQQQQHLHQPMNNLPSPGTPSKVIPPEGLSCYGNERQMLQDQAKFYNSSTLSDVTLIVGDQTYHAHKLLLIRSSDVFERMFSSEWADPEKKVRGEIATLSPFSVLNQINVFPLHQHGFNYAHTYCHT
jgi:hypothetical protein